MFKEVDINSIIVGLKGFPNGHELAIALGTLRDARKKLPEDDDTYSDDEVAAYIAIHNQLGAVLALFKSKLDDQQRDGGADYNHVEANALQFRKFLDLAIETQNELANYFPRAEREQQRKRVEEFDKQVAKRQADYDAQIQIRSDLQTNVQTIEGLVQTIPSLHSESEAAKKLVEKNAVEMGVWRKQWFALDGIINLLNEHFVAPEGNPRPQGINESGTVKSETVEALQSFTREHQGELDEGLRSLVAQFSDASILPEARVLAAKATKLQTELQEVSKVQKRMEDNARAIAQCDEKVKAKAESQPTLSAAYQQLLEQLEAQRELFPEQAQEEEDASSSMMLRSTFTKGFEELRAAVEEVKQHTSLESKEDMGELERKAKAAQELAEPLVQATVALLQAKEQPLQAALNPQSAIEAQSRIWPAKESYGAKSTQQESQLKPHDFTDQNLTLFLGQRDASEQFDAAQDQAKREFAKQNPKQEVHLVVRAEAPPAGGESGGTPRVEEERLAVDGARVQVVDGKALQLELQQLNEKIAFYEKQMHANSAEPRAAAADTSKPSGLLVVTPKKRQREPINIALYRHQQQQLESAVKERATIIEKLDFQVKYMNAHLKALATRFAKVEFKIVKEKKPVAAAAHPTLEQGGKDSAPVGDDEIAAAQKMQEIPEQCASEDLLEIMQRHIAEMQATIDSLQGALLEAEKAKPVEEEQEHSRAPKGQLESKAIIMLSSKIRDLSARVAEYLVKRSELQKFLREQAPQSQITKASVDALKAKSKEGVSVSGSEDLSASEFEHQVFVAAKKDAGFSGDNQYVRAGNGFRTAVQSAQVDLTHDSLMAVVDCVRGPLFPSGSSSLGGFKTSFISGALGIVEKAHIARTDVDTLQRQVQPPREAMGVPMSEQERGHWVTAAETVLQAASQGDGLSEEHLAVGDAEKTVFNPKELNDAIAILRTSAENYNRQRAAVSIGGSATPGARAVVSGVKTPNSGPQTPATASSGSQRDGVSPALLRQSLAVVHEAAPAESLLRVPSSQVLFWGQACFYGNNESDGKACRRAQGDLTINLAVQVIAEKLQPTVAAEMMPPVTPGGGVHGAPVGGNAGTPQGSPQSALTPAEAARARVDARS